MIAKHIAMRAEQKSRFASLVAYLTDPQSKQERVGDVMTTNCHSHDTESACLEILNTQALNKRARSDKTYHLVISFAANDMPDTHALKTIEQRLCEELGFTEHQRISVVHHDTDNLHVHVAINKIHPARYTIHNPHADFKTLGDTCAILERAFYLTLTNHQAGKSASENMAADMEHHTGVNSLLGWVKRECSAQIKMATTWDELHQVLEKNGLELREHGNGFVFKAKDGTTVKASAVDRAFSKVRLETNFGKFIQPTKTEGEASRSYSKKPLMSGAIPDRLFALYQSEQSQNKTTWSSEQKSLSARRERMMMAAKRRGTLERALIKLTGGSRLEKKMAYRFIATKTQREISKIRAECADQRAAIARKYKGCSWAEWLRQRAGKNDQDALRALRMRTSCNTERNGIRGKGKTVAKSYPDDWDSVTKKGTIILKGGAASVRDDGAKLFVVGGATIAGLKAVLCMAIERYGECIHLEGTADFRDRVVRVAVEAGIHVRFDAPDLEALHRVMMQKAMTEGGGEDVVGAAIGRSPSPRVRTASKGTTRKKTR